MQKRITLIGVILILALLTAACGGENAAVETAVSDTEETAGNTATTENNTGSADEGESEEETAAEGDAAAGEETEETMEGEEAEEGAETEETEATAETAEEEAGGDTIAGRPASGNDPDTGMQINPPEIIQGEEFLVRGEVISLNLTPQTEPEFLVEAPNGQKYRIQSQELSAISYDDGAEIQPHQFQIGLLAEATVYQDPGAGLTTVLQSEDFRILKAEE